MIKSDARLRRRLWSLTPLIGRLDNALEACTPFLDRVPGELSATLTLSGSFLFVRDPGTIRISQVTARIHAFLDHPFL
jgi:hypothetical protein